ncbi:hypothetical protein [Shewanella youngdeokensis]|uniref:Iron transporter n=1 Tax=Shewanella youngdeokensis TaxID=2999068 RepID=A0ABZ0K1W2_9GAMM|nr:hypothetical protein RGE70_07165 [Shewanella sp. DAU334]
MSFKSIPLGMNRLEFSARLVLATVGNYFLCALFTATLSHLPNTNVAFAIERATTLSLLLFTLISIWVFCARSALYAWAIAAAFASLLLFAYQFLTVWS